MGAAATLQRDGGSGEWAARMDQALQRAIERLVELGFALERLTPDGFAELHRGDQAVRLWMSDGEVWVTGDVPEAPPAPAPEPVAAQPPPVAPAAEAPVVPEPSDEPGAPMVDEGEASTFDPDPDAWEDDEGDRAFLDRPGEADEEAVAGPSDHPAPPQSQWFDEPPAALSGAEQPAPQRTRSRMRGRRLLFRVITLLILLALAALLIVIMGEEASSQTPVGVTGAALLGAGLRGSTPRSPRSRQGLPTWRTPRGSQRAALLRSHHSGATSPSGKARVCKTLITGSIPVVASSSTGTAALTRRRSAVIQTCGGPPRPLSLLDLRRLAAPRYWDLRREAATEHTRESIVDELRCAHDEHSVEALRIANPDTSERCFPQRPLKLE
jgi:hypothetical protein